MALFLCNNPSPTPSDILLSKFDFTKDTDYLVDEVNPQKTVSITSGITHDSNGLFFPSSGNYAIDLSSYNYVFSNFTKVYAEIDFGEINIPSNPTSNVRFIMYDSTYGLIYRGGSSNNYWAVYNNNTWLPSSGDTDVNTFSNSTLKIICDNDLKFYKNDALFYTVANFLKTNPSFNISSSGNYSLHNAYVKGFRLYAKQ